MIEEKKTAVSIQSKHTDRIWWQLVMTIWIAQRKTQLIRKLPETKRKTVVAPHKESKKPFFDQRNRF